MVRKLAITALVLAVCGFAQDVSSSSLLSSSSGFLGLPDTLSQELQNVAQEGFWSGFKMASAVMLACSGLLIVLHLVNRGAGR